MEVYKNHLLKDEDIIEEAAIHWTSLIPHILLMCVGIGFITIIFALLRMLTTKLIVTNKRIIGKVGVISVHTMDSPLSKINNITVDQGIIGRIFDYGKLIIYTSSGAHHFKQIVAPHKFKNNICELIDDEQNQLLKQMKVIENRINA